MVLSKEPALVISTVAAIIVGALATLSGNGFISAAAAGHATDLVNAGGQLLVLFVPFLAAGLATRSQVYSKATVDQIVTAVEEPQAPVGPPDEPEADAPAPPADPAPVTDEPTDPPATVG